MKREVVTPIVLGFFALEFNRWLADEDTIEGHVANIVKGVKDHEKVTVEVVKSKE